MNCISPPELDDRRLFEFLDGEADQETAHHLGRCQYCRDKAEALARLQKRLTTRLYRLTCPSPSELGEYHLRMLPASQMLVVGQHVRDCPHCAEEVAQLEQFLRELTPAPEDNLLAKARVLIARLVGENRESRLSGQTAFAPALIALRGESKVPITFEADGILITLDFQAGTAGRISILGQVATDDQDQWTGAEAKIHRAGTLLRTLFLDDLGAFRWEEAQPGSIQITLTSRDGIEVQILNIDIDV